MRLRPRWETWPLRRAHGKYAAMAANTDTNPWATRRVRDLREGWR